MSAKGAAAHRQTANELSDISGGALDTAPVLREFPQTGIGQGALIISLDFELHWGVRDHRPLDAPERRRLLAARAVVPEILNAFREHKVRATWATVGLLFARSREEAEACRPQSLPKYERRELNPYCESLGRDEEDDPFHFAPSLVRTIAQQPGQEVGSHSYSHYHSLEAGQGEHEFSADVASAKRIAENSGCRLRSYVFPRNQVRAGYLPALAAAGFCTYRGTEQAASKASVPFSEQRRPWSRALRLADAYWDVNGPQTWEWPRGGDPVAPAPIAVAASRYLRPFTPALRALEGVRLERIAQAMKQAAGEKRIFHLWWHPEDFAPHPERNLDFLHRVLHTFEECRREWGMVSLSMDDVTSVEQATKTALCGAGQ
jgi:peptidoglycan/xylan/chitin deacetylase (PgdA/CDA1 family)